MASTAQFHQNFWGQENAGFEVLLQNMKAGITASKELGEFIKERLVTEDGYVKGLSKLHKSTNHISGSTLGTFGPLWELLKEMCEKLVTIHSKFVKMLIDLSREIGEYNHSQKEKLKTNMRGEIEQAQECLVQYQATENSLQRTKKHYQQCAEQSAKINRKLEKARAESATNPKAKEKMNGYESRAKQAQGLLDNSKKEHEDAVKKHCNHLMEFQGKMSEACMKFESLEEEHLAQMVTFMGKITQTQDMNHVNIAELYSILNSQLDILTVEKLLKDFTKEKGTGTDKPTPYKFRPIRLEALVNNTSLSASSEDVSSAGKSNPKAEKTLRSRFKKKPKNVTTNGSVEPTQSQNLENAPEVDEEGYSIRPEDAANISRFPDDPVEKRGDSESDSDFDDEPESYKIRNIKIRESSTQPASTVDDIKASMMSLRLNAGSPVGIKKATSSQSLNIMAGGNRTPPSSRKITATTSSNNIAEQSNVASLLDIDVNTSGPQMPIPLLPAAPNSKRGGNVPQIPAPLLPISPSSSASKGKASNIPAPLISLASPTGEPPASFDNKALNITASLPPWGISSPPNLSTSATSKVDPPTTASSSQDTSSPSLPRPRTSSIKSQSEASALASIPAPPIPTKRRSAGALPNPSSDAPLLLSNGNKPLSNPPSLLTQFPSLLQPTPSSSGQDPSITKVNSGSKSLDSSPILGRKDPIQLLSASSSSLGGEDQPPVPAPRGASLFRHAGESPSANSLSPLATNQISARSVTPTSPAMTTPTLPIAIAIQETCNAIFKGTNSADCQVKVTGEVAISFPASYLPKLGSYEPLSFKTSGMDKVEKILHNQHLIKKSEDGAQYSFEMESLMNYLKKMQAKASSPFYNVQVLKYEVNVSDGSQLPLQLLCYMKCDASVTNFRLDYTYQPGVFQSKPTLSGVSIYIPVNGGVKNALTKPVGKWCNESNHMMWAIGDIPPPDNPAASPLHAKFDLNNGPSSPSSAVASFTCEGETLSNLSLDLTSSAYKVSLFKKKCISGKYTAEPKVQ